MVLNGQHDRKVGLVLYQAPRGLFNTSPIQSQLTIATAPWVGRVRKEVTDDVVRIAVWDYRHYVIDNPCAWGSATPFLLRMLFLAIGSTQDPRAYTD